ncbi:hypothetical protein Ait01nite_045190 [Actinoplanes italicus]|uniref:Uncharacterized protein n=1 Tax=Actinoplanes italicus TaxID=113567 RepID=A0A2T0KCM5_9ACTN|nr:hypothetical protein [Actinoplanes italicus]PRX20999.1 hypothetical protein CLV67_107276 [Actinoplanes italicus]GIE31474.1 hypothetical protein Ait01nite_045190 [Actinoplanes italicus]
MRAVLPVLALMLGAGCVSLPDRGSTAPPSSRPSYPVVVDEFRTILDRTRAASFSYTVEADLPGESPLTASGDYDPTGTDLTGLDRFAEAIKDVRLAGPNLYWVYIQTDKPSAGGESFMPIGAPGKVHVFSPYGGAVRVDVTTDDAGWVTSFVVEATTGSSGMRLATTLTAHGKPVATG